MNFNSFLYILLFLPAVLILCEISRRLPFARAPQVCILAASLFFYAWVRPWHLVYLLGSILTNWLLGRRIGTSSQPRRKYYLRAGLALNICFLCTFKYSNFLLRMVPYFARHPLALPELAFPLGISFFTLTQIMYLVDCYEDLNPPSSLLDHATFVSFFPYVISGPISKAKRILHQFPGLNERVRPSTAQVASAMYLFSLGLIKKVVVADAFSRLADYGFTSATNMSALEAWCFVSAYTLQIYFDFSGYSDMAIASALLLGIEIPRNFDAPLRSLSIIEFWQRWHISLSSFITTYLYTPILKSFRRATLETASVATLLSMAIAGLWHGPSWGFVIFGILHGIGLVVNQYWRKKKMPALPHFVSWLVTFALVDVAFVFFHSHTLAGALGYLRYLVSWHHPLSVDNLHVANGNDLMAILFAVSQIVGLVVALTGKSSEARARDFVPSGWTWAQTVAFTLIAWLFLNSNVSAPFVYFGF